MKNYRIKKRLDSQNRPMLIIYSAVGLPMMVHVGINKEVDLNKNKVKFSGIVRPGFVALIKTLKSGIIKMARFKVKQQIIKSCVICADHFGILIDTVIVKKVNQGKNCDYCTDLHGRPQYRGAIA